MGLNNNGWKSWGATVIGPAHEKLGVPNQDAWLSHYYSWGDVVVVSDGLGSKKKSDIGSLAVCSAVVQAAEICKGFPEENIEYFLRLIHSLWLVTILPYSPNECSATCLFVINMREKCLIAQLGDGIIAAIGKDEQSIIFDEDKQDSFSNLTYCIGENFKIEQWRTYIASPNKFEAFVLCTDGISDDITPERKLSFARELYLSYSNYSLSERKKEIRFWLKNWPVPNHSDDKTVACLYRGKMIDNG